MISVLLVLSSIAVLAEDPAKDYDYPLTVTGLAQGEVAHFYKVIEWVGETEDDSDVSGWKAVSPFDSILNKTALTAVLVGNPKAEPAVAATGITEDLAGQLARAASGTPEDVTADAAGKATFNNPSAGMWMALITPGDANTLYNPVFVSADFDKTEGHEGTIAVTDTYGPNAAAKKSTLTLTKEAHNASDYTPDDAKTTAIGDTVSFTVNTAIPGYGEVYQNPYFELTDTLENLALDTTSVTLVKPSGLTKKAEGVTKYDYEVTATANGYTILFTADYLKTVKSATEVQVTYNAEVTGEAVYAINEEDNDVYIKYSHDPHNNSDYDVKKDTTQHYTFSLDAAGLGNSETWKGVKTSELVKVGIDAAGNPIKTEKQTSAITSKEEWEGPLEHAVFELYKKDDLNINDQGKVTGIKEGKSAFKTAETTADGRMNFAGLDAGTYYLKEKSAPAGFVTNSDWHKIEIEAQTETITVTEYFKDGTWSSTNSEGAKAAT